LVGEIACCHRQRASSARTYAERGWSTSTSARSRLPFTCGYGRRRIRLGARGLRNRHGRRISLIGWSLGGIYARELARRFAPDVRQVITLASPFRDVEATNVPRFLRERTRGRGLPDEADYRRMLDAPLPVPTTAIYSRTDGIAAWRSCCLEEGPFSESLEVESSHLGIGHHPVALLAIADRLAQPEDAWKHFTPPPGWRWPLVPRRRTPSRDEPPR